MQASLRSLAKYCRPTNRQIVSSAGFCDPEGTGAIFPVRPHRSMGDIYVARQVSGRAGPVSPIGWKG